MRGLIGVLAFAAALLLLGWTGESDRSDELAYAPVHAEIVASAPTWAVTR